MRLVHVTTVPMSLAFLRGQLAFMAERGFDISVISSPGPDLDRLARELDVPAEAVPMTRAITPLRDAVALLRLTRKLRALRPAIVHAHTPKGGLLGMLAATLARAPIRIYHMRGLPLVTQRGLRRRLLVWCEWLSCRAAHEVLCVSHSLRDVAIAEGLCAPDKIKVLAHGSGNGVDDIRFRPRGDRAATRARYGVPDDAVVIGFVGRLVRDKGVVELLDAWRALSARFPTLHLIIVGMLEDRDALPAEAIAQLEGDARIHWKGVDWDAPPLYAAMDIVALPTYREGFPNVPLEAAAMELPVVATRIPGCTDAIADGTTGTLVAPRDADALAAALARYVADPALRRAHGRAARTRVAQMFGQQRVWEALHDEYRRLAEVRG